MSAEKEGIGEGQYKWSEIAMIEREEGGQTCKIKSSE